MWQGSFIVKPLFVVFALLPLIVSMTEMYERQQPKQERTAAMEAILQRSFIF